MISRNFHLNLARRLSEKQKIEIIRDFTSGLTIDCLSKKFACTKLTITRNLKNNLGVSKYKELINKNKKLEEKNFGNKNVLNIELENKTDQKIFKLKSEDIPDSKSEQSEENLVPSSPFVEITPLHYEIENTPRQDFSSVPISEIDFPQTVYMIVDKNIELQVKQLKDYPEWSFLSLDDLNRKTIEIFFDLKTAKRFCNKEQKVLKVPNTNVFKIVAPILVEKGISRIVSSDQLISL